MTLPLNAYEKPDKAWSMCIGAIDEANRQLNNKPAKKQLRLLQQL